MDNLEATDLVKFIKQDIRFKTGKTAQTRDQPGDPAEGKGKLRSSGHIVCLDVVDSDLSPGEFPEFRGAAGMVDISVGKDNVADFGDAEFFGVIVYAAGITQQTGVDDNGGFRLDDKPTVAANDASNPMNARYDFDVVPSCLQHDNPRCNGKQWQEQSFGFVLK